MNEQGIVVGDQFPVRYRKILQNPVRDAFEVRHIDLPAPTRSTEPGLRARAISVGLHTDAKGGRAVRRPVHFRVSALRLAQRLWL